VSNIHYLTGLLRATPYFIVVILGSLNQQHRQIQ
jgi:hypothetical protein